MIKHVMADGRELDSIEGIVIPTTGPTAAVYQIIANHAKQRTKSDDSKNNERLIEAQAV